MEKAALKSVIESIIFAADHPVSIDRFAGVLEGEKREDIKEALAELADDYGGSGNPESEGENGANPHGIYIEEIAGGFQFRTRPVHAPW
ncbi:MAG: SMC-Scp complex subunit ScpB, partial [Deltaproteobacteria bacterium]|nr:SMC-Scp complex subunit ScpB [Deltaproteobacteria bacterium]